MRVSAAALILSCLASTCLAKPIALQRRTTDTRPVLTVLPLGGTHLKAPLSSHHHPHSVHLHTHTHASTGYALPSTSSVPALYVNGTIVGATHYSAQSIGFSTSIVEAVSVPPDAPVPPSTPLNDVTTVYITSTVIAEVQCSATPSDSQPPSYPVSVLSSTSIDILPSTSAPTISYSKHISISYTDVDSSKTPTSTPTHSTIVSLALSSEALLSTSTHSTVLHRVSSSIVPSSSAAQSTTVLPSSKSVTSTPSSPSSYPISSRYQQGVVSAIGVITDTFDNKTKAWQQMGGWVGAVVYKTIMDYDHWTGSKSQESMYGAALLDIVTDQDLLNSSGAVDGFNDDQAWWVLAFLRAYQNYGHVELLNQAIKQWKQIQASSQTTTEDASTAPNLGGLKRTQVIPAGCNVAGAVYWEQTPDSGLTAISTSLFAQMGAELYAFTKDEQFRQGADAAIGWLRSMMLSETGIMNIDHVDIDGCTKGLGSLTYNTGVYLSAITSLYQSTGEAQYLEWATLTANSSVTGSFGNEKAEPLVVQEVNNVVTDDGSFIWRDVLFRSLNEFYELLKSENRNPELQGQITTFFQANYNQIMNHAKYGDAYSANWFGLMPTGTAWGTGGVLSVLIGSMLMF